MIRLAILLSFSASTALAHSGADAVPEGRGLAVLLPLACLAFVYAKGFLAMAKRRTIDASHLRRATAFAAGHGAIAVALIGPLPTLAQTPFAAHMIEHELLIVVAAPLLVIARPGREILLGFRVPQRKLIVQLLHQCGLLKAWRVGCGLQVATIAHGMVLWLWHLPTVFHAALNIEVLHRLQHGSFLLTGLWFWQAIMSAAAKKQMVLAITDLFATTMHMGLLGALIALARFPIYQPGAGPVDTLFDQQLAGLIMWVPGCLAYAVAALLIAARLLRPAREARHALSG